MTTADIENPPSHKEKNKQPFSLFAKHNRGLLLDLSVFVANIFLMRYLTRYVMMLFDQASNNDPTASFMLLSGSIAMWVLPVAGSVLKRWHFHRRMAAERKSLASTQTSLVGCVFNPILYFCLNLVVMAAIVAGVSTVVMGPKSSGDGYLFVPSIFVGLGLTIFQTYMIYRYFTPPKKKPTSDLLLSPISESLGDVCFFLNMLLFQVAWNMLTSEVGRVGSVSEFIGRLFFLTFLALLVYFPPRMFYLAEDINRPRTWLTMLLANSPVIFRVVIGTSKQAGW